MEGAPRGPGVWAIVLNYEGLHVLGDCLKSLRQQDYPNLHAVVVDNASTDGSAKMAEEADGVELIRNPENLFFSGGNNVGIKRAMEAGADYVVLINNDTVFKPDIIGKMVAALEADDEKAGIAGPKIYYHEQPDIIWSAGGLVDFTKGWVRHRGIRQRDNGQYNAPAEVDYVTGCCLMFKREVYKYIGGLDEIFPMYFEDTDFCTRARKAGFKVIYVPGASMWHKISYSSGGEFSWKKIRRRARSQRRFFMKHSTRAQLAVMPFWQVVEFIRVAGMLIRRRIAGK